MTSPRAQATLGPKWVVAALLAGLVAAVTIFLRVPIPKSGGYLNLGDIIIVFAGLYLGQYQACLLVVSARQSRTR